MEWSKKTFHFSGILIETYTKTIRFCVLDWFLCAIQLRPHQLSRDRNLEPFLKCRPKGTIIPQRIENEDKWGLVTSLRSIIYVLTIQEVIKEYKNSWRSNSRIIQSKLSVQHNRESYIECCLSSHELPTATGYRLKNASSSSLLSPTASSSSWWKLAKGFLGPLCQYKFTI